MEATQDPYLIPIELEYDGPAYQGEMSALELSTVLQGVAEYGMALASSGALGPSPKVRTVVRDFAPGSFDFTALIEVLGQVKETYVVMAGAGFAWWWQRMRHVVSDFEHLADRGMVKVTFTDGSCEEWTEAQWKLFKDRRARRAIAKIVSPLKSKATRLRVRTPWDTDVTYTKDDAPHFEEPAPEAPAPETRTVLAYPEAVNFDPAKPWRLWTQAYGAFSARIEDRAFLSGVERGKVRVGKTDSFKLQVREEFDGREGSGPRYYIEQVIEHSRGAVQDGLPEAEPRGLPTEMPQGDSG